MRNRTRLARLRHWVKVLEKVEKDKRKFDMGYWAVPPDGGDVGDCGTAACGLGWAGLDPKFRNAGLETHKSWVRGAVIYGDAAGVTAAERFFGITEREAIEIVAPHKYRAAAPSLIKPRTVIARIGKLIKKYDGARA